MTATEIFRLINNFNPRPPWGGRHNADKATTGTRIISIHALRGEGDVSRVCHICQLRNFNPRPPWGGRPVLQTFNHPQVKISIHALRGEGDHVLTLKLRDVIYFNPRPPWGGRRQQQKRA